MFWFAAICFAIVYVANMVLALMQSKNYTTAYTALRAAAVWPSARRRACSQPGRSPCS